MQGDGFYLLMKMDPNGQADGELEPGASILAALQQQNNAKAAEAK